MFKSCIFKDYSIKIIDDDFEGVYTMGGNTNYLYDCYKTIITIYSIKNLPVAQNLALFIIKYVGKNLSKNNNLKSYVNQFPEDILIIKEVEKILLFS